MLTREATFENCYVAFYSYLNWLAGPGGRTVGPPGVRGGRGGRQVRGRHGRPGGYRQVGPNWLSMSMLRKSNTILQWLSSHACLKF